MSSTGEPVHELAPRTIFPHPPQKMWEEAVDALVGMVKQHSVDLIAVGAVVHLEDSGLSTACGSRGRDCIPGD